MERYAIITAAIVSFAASAFARNPSDEGASVLVIHRCTNNPLTRSVGVLGGRQPEFLLKRPDIRNESPPQTDELTRVLDVTRRKSLSNPTADPMIDKCASSFRWDERVELVILTVLWDERNCTIFGTREEPPDCRSRTAFGFSLDELSIREFPHTKQQREVLHSHLLREFVADVYFTQQMRPRTRRPDTGLWMPATAEVHLVARVVPLEDSLEHTKR
ncbi:MAG: hypothetical protein BMS9Abin37_0234 [Acidobacteriota bacterium]|nr:MAG: hypothetical protein BMS9Abin37_0234 [Acidobacteriota bacterium]